MDEHRHLPDANRLSVLMATILLAYALMPFIKLPEQDLVLRLPGAGFLFRFNFATFISIMVALLSAVGTDWLLRGHPHIQKQGTIQHWLIPTLTAWALGTTLNTIEVGARWWGIFGFGVIMLTLVFVGEYIVVDLSDARHVPASVGLTAVSFALCLILAIALRAAGLRLYLLLPALVITVTLISVRALYLRLGGRWCIAWGVGIGIFVGQFALGLHYTPASALTYGLLILGILYALTSLAGSLEEKRSFRSIWIEPGIMLVLLWGLAFLLRG